MLRNIKALILVAVFFLPISQTAHASFASNFGHTKQGLINLAAKNKRCATYRKKYGRSSDRDCADCNRDVCIILRYQKNAENYFKQYTYALFDLDGRAVTPFIYDRLEFSGTAENKLLLAAKDQRMGFIDSLGNTVIAFKYRNGTGFRDGLFCANAEEGSNLSSKQSCAYINSKGEVVIAPGLWESSTSFSDGLAAVKDENDKYAYINTAGKLVTPFKSNFGGRFVAGRALIASELGYGFIDKLGAVVIPPQYSEAHTFDESGTAAVKGEQGWGYINKDGEPVTQLIYDEVESDFVDDVAEVTLCKTIKLDDDDDEAKKVCRFGLVSSTGYQILPVKFQKISIERVGDDKVIIAAIRTRYNLFYCLYDYLGTPLTGCTYDRINIKGDRIYAAQYLSKDIANEVETGFGEHSASPRIRRDVNFHGVLDFHGRVIVPFEYTEIDKLNDGKILAKNKIKYVTYDKDGLILKTQFLPQTQGANK